MYYKQLRDYDYVSPEKIKNIILGVDIDRKKMLIEHFTEHNEFYLSKIGKGTSLTTANRYKLTKLRLEEFLKAEYNLSNIPVFELTPVFVEKFSLFLMNTHNCRSNTTLKFIQRFRAVFHYIKNTGADIKINPFDSLKFRTTEVVGEILTQEEIDTIDEKEFLTERLDQVRDIFIFMCYTGLSYIDAAQLTKDNIKTVFDGYQW